MQLRTKLLISFSFMILLAGVIAYTGYDAIVTMNNYQDQSTSCNNADSYILDGRRQAANFMLDRKPERLTALSESFQKAVEQLMITKELSYTKENRDASAKVIEFIENAQSGYLLLSENQKQIENDIKKGVKISKDVEDVCLKLANELGKIGNADLVIGMLVDFYGLRIMSWRFQLESTEKMQKELMASLNKFIVDTKKYQKSFVAEPKVYKLFQQLVGSMEAYTESIEKYTNSILLLYANGDKAHKIIREADNENGALVERVVKNQNAKQEYFKITLLIVTLAVLVFGIFITVFLTRNVLAQLGRDPGVLVSASKKVIDGDFDIDDKGKKLGVYGAFVDMVKNLEENIHKAERQTEMAKEESQKAQEATARAEEAQRQAERAKRDGMLSAAEQLEGVVAILSSASEQLSAQIEQSSRGAEQQSERVAETATAMEEMNSTVLEVARNSGQASELSEQAKEKAKAGSEIVHEAGGKMTILQEQSQVLKTDMNELDQHATAISEIMSVISDIADQTNLLALNAAIEAARAGEYGRGFAVVADEVRKLAEKTMASTSDVSNAITQIQESASKNIRSVDRTNAIIEEVMEKAKAASSALDEIVNLVDHSADQIRAIATASEEQSATSEEINRSIAEVNTISSETSQAMQEASQAVVELSNQAQELSGLIQTMKNS